MKTINSILSFLLTCVASVVMWSCIGSDETPSGKSMNSQHTYILALDLSDRLMNPESVSKDIACIENVFSQFEKEVTKKRFVGSKDQFLITLIPQTSNRNNTELVRLSESLSLNLSESPIRNKRVDFLAFKERLSNDIVKLYDTAMATKTFSGADIYKFMDQILPDQLDMAKGNEITVVLLTDGYIEMDNKSETVQRGALQNHMNKRILDQLRHSESYQSNSDILITPNRLASKPNLENLNLCIVGIYPKGSYIYELDMLEKIWGTWLDKINCNYHLINYGDTKHTTVKLLNDAIQQN